MLSQHGITVDKRLHGSRVLESGACHVLQAQPASKPWQDRALETCMTVLKAMFVVGAVFLYVLVMLIRGIALYLWPADAQPWSLRVRQIQCC